MIKMPTLGGGTREDRIQSLQTLNGALGSIHDAGEVLVQTGELLRHREAVHPDLGGVEAALAALTPAGVLGYLRSVAVEELPAQLRRAADEAVEAALAEDPEERELYAASALDALVARDRAESVRVAVARFLELCPAAPAAAATAGSASAPASAAEAAAGELTAAFTQFRQSLAGVDLELRGKARLLTPLNGRRRVERDLLDPAHREEAWWFTGRAECDELLRMLSGDVPRTGAHVERCPDCRRDLDRAGVVETQPKDRHLSSDDAWRLELGELPEDEKQVLQRHAEDCLECAQVMWAMQEGDEAIEELAQELARAGEEAGADTGRPFSAPSAGRTGGMAARTARSHREVTRREHYRVIVVRAERVRVVVQPQRGRGLALAVMSLPPQRNVYQPKQTDEGLEFDLGDVKDVGGRTAKLTVRVREGGENETVEVPL